MELTDDDVSISEDSHMLLETLVTNINNIDNANEFNELYSLLEEEKGLDEISEFLSEIEKEASIDDVIKTNKTKAESITSKLSAIFIQQRLMADSSSDTMKGGKGSKNKDDQESLLKELNALSNEKETSASTHRQDAMKLLLLQKQNTSLSKHVLLAEQKARNIQLQWVSDKQKFHNDKDKLEKLLFEANTRLSIMEQTVRFTEQVQRDRFAAATVEDTAIEDNNTSNNQNNDLDIDQLQIKVLHLQGELADKKKLLSQLSIECSDTKLELLNTTQRLEILSARVEEFSNMESNLQAKIDKAEEENTNLTNTNRRLGIDLNDLKTKLNDHKEEFLAMEDNYKTQIDELESKIHLLNDTTNLDNLEKKLNEITLEYQEYKKNSQNKINSLEINVQSLNLENTINLKDKDLLLISYQKVIKNIKIYEDNIEKYHELMDKRLKNIATKTLSLRMNVNHINHSEIKKTTDTKANIEDEVEMQKMLLDRAKEDADIEIEELNKKISLLQKDLKNKDKQFDQKVATSIQAISKERDDIQIELNTANKVIESLNLQKENLILAQHTNATSTSAFTELQLQVTNYEIEKKSLLLDLDTKDNMIDKLKSEINQLNTSFSTVNDRLQTITKEKNRIEALQKALINSNKEELLLKEMQANLIFNEDHETQTLAFLNNGFISIDKMNIENLLNNSLLTDNYYYSTDGTFTNKYPMEDRLLQDLVTTFHGLSGNLFNTIKNLTGVGENIIDSSMKEELTVEDIVKAVEGLLVKTAQDMVVNIESAKERGLDQLKEKQQDEIDLATEDAKKQIVIDMQTKFKKEFDLIEDQQVELEHKLQKTLELLDIEKKKNDSLTKAAAASKSVKNNLKNIQSKVMAFAKKKNEKVDDIINKTKNNENEDYLISLTKNMFKKDKKVVENKNNIDNNSVDLNDEDDNAMEQNELENTGDGTSDRYEDIHTFPMRKMKTSSNKNITTTHSKTTTPKPGNKTYTEDELALLSYHEKQEEYEKNSMNDPLSSPSSSNLNKNKSHVNHEDIVQDNNFNDEDDDNPDSKEALDMKKNRKSSKQDKQFGIKDENNSQVSSKRKVSAQYTDEESDIADKVNNSHEEDLIDEYREDNLNAGVEVTTMKKENTRKPRTASKIKTSSRINEGEIENYDNQDISENQFDHNDKDDETVITNRENQISTPNKQQQPKRVENDGNISETQDQTNEDVEDNLNDDDNTTNSTPNLQSKSKLHNNSVSQSRKSIRNNEEDESSFENKYSDDVEEEGIVYRGNQNKINSEKCKSTKVKPSLRTNDEKEELFLENDNNNDNNNEEYQEEDIENIENSSNKERVKTKTDNIVSIQQRKKQHSFIKQNDNASNEDDVDDNFNSDRDNGEGIDINDNQTENRQSVKKNHPNNKRSANSYKSTPQKNKDQEVLNELSNDEENTDFDDDNNNRVDIQKPISKNSKLSSKNDEKSLVKKNKNSSDSNRDENSDKKPTNNSKTSKTSDNKNLKVTKNKNNKLSENKNHENLSSTENIKKSTSSIEGKDNNEVIDENKQISTDNSINPVNVLLKENINDIKPTPLLSNETVIPSKAELIRKNFNFNENDNVVAILHVLNDQQRDELQSLVLDEIAEDVRKKLFEKSIQELSIQDIKNKNNIEKNNLLQDYSLKTLYDVGDIQVSDFERLHNGHFGTDDLIAITVLEHRISYGQKSLVENEKDGSIIPEDEKKSRQQRMLLRSVAIQKELLVKNVTKNVSVLELLKYKHNTEVAISEITALNIWKTIRSIKSGGNFKDVLLYHLDVIDYCIREQGGWQQGLIMIEESNERTIRTDQWPDFFRVKVLELYRKRCEDIIEKQKNKIAVNREMLLKSSLEGMNTNYMSTLPFNLSIDTNANKQRMENMTNDAAQKAGDILDNKGYSEINKSIGDIRKNINAEADNNSINNNNNNTNSKDASMKMNSSEDREQNLMNNSENTDKMIPNNNKDGAFTRIKKDSSKRSKLKNKSNSSNKFHNELHTGDNSPNGSESDVYSDLSDGTSTRGNIKRRRNSIAVLLPRMSKEKKNIHDFSDHSTQMSFHEREDDDEDDMEETRECLVKTPNDLVDSLGNTIKTTKSSLVRSKRNLTMNKLNFDKYQIYQNIEKANTNDEFSLNSLERKILSRGTHSDKLLIQDPLKFWDDSTSETLNNKENDKEIETNNDSLMKTNQDMDDNTSNKKMKSLMIDEKSSYFKWMHISADKLLMSVLYEEPYSFELMKCIVDGITFWQDKQLDIASSILKESQNIIKNDDNIMNINSSNSSLVPELVEELLNMIDKKSKPPLIINQIKEKFANILKYCENRNNNSNSSNDLLQSNSSDLPNEEYKEMNHTKIDNNPRSKINTFRITKNESNSASKGIQKKSISQLPASNSKSKMVENSTQTIYGSIELLRLSKANLKQSYSSPSDLINNSTSPLKINTLTNQHDHTFVLDISSPLTSDNQIIPILHSKNNQQLSMIQYSPDHLSDKDQKKSKDFMNNEQVSPSYGCIYAFFNESEFELLPGVKLANAHRVIEGLTSNKNKSMKNILLRREELHIGSWINETNVRYCIRSKDTPSAIYGKTQLKLAPRYLNLPSIPDCEAVLFPNVLTLQQGINLITGNTYNSFGETNNVVLPENVLLLQVASDRMFSLPHGLREVKLSNIIKLSSTLDKYIHSSSSNIIPPGHQLVQLIQNSDSQLPTGFDISSGISLASTPNSWNIPNNLRLIKNPLNNPLPDSLIKVTCVTDEEDYLVSELKTNEFCSIVNRPRGIDFSVGVEILRRPSGHPLPPGMTLISKVDYPEGLELASNLELVQLTPRFDFPFGSRINSQWKIWPRPNGMRLPPGVQIVFPDSSSSGGPLPPGVIPVIMPNIPYGTLLPPNAQAVEILGSTGGEQPLPPGAILGPGLIVLDNRKLIAKPDIHSSYDNSRGKQAINALIIRRQPNSVLPPLVDRGNMADLPFGTLLAENIDIVRVAVRFELPPGVRIDPGVKLGPFTQIAPGTELISLCGGHTNSYALGVLEWPHGVRLSSGFELVRRPPTGFYLPFGYEEVVSINDNKDEENKLPNYGMLVKLPIIISYATSLQLAEKVTVGLESTLELITRSPLPPGMIIAARTSKKMLWPSGMTSVSNASLNKTILSALDKINYQLDDNSLTSSEEIKKSFPTDFHLEVIQLNPRFSFPPGTEIIPGIFIQRKPFWLQAPPGVELVNKHQNSNKELLTYCIGITRVSIRPDYINTNYFNQIDNDMIDTNTINHEPIDLEHIKSSIPAILPDDYELILINGELFREVYSWGPYLPGIECVELSTDSKTGELLQKLPPYHFLIERPLQMNNKQLPMGFQLGISAAYSYWNIPSLLPNIEIMHMIPSYDLPIGINIINTSVLSKNKLNTNKKLTYIPELIQYEKVYAGLSVISKPFGSIAYTKLMATDFYYRDIPHAFILIDDIEHFKLPEHLMIDNNSDEIVNKIFGDELLPIFRIGFSSKDEISINNNKFKLVSNVIKFVKISKGFPDPRERNKPAKRFVPTVNKTNKDMINKNKLPIIYPRLIQIHHSNIKLTTDIKTDIYLINTQLHKLMGLKLNQIETASDSYLHDHNNNNRYYQYNRQTDTRQESSLLDSFPYALGIKDTDIVLIPRSGDINFIQNAEERSPKKEDSLDIVTNEEVINIFSKDDNQDKETIDESINTDTQVIVNNNTKDKSIFAPIIQYNEIHTQTTLSSVTEQINELSLWRIQDLVEKLENENRSYKELIENFSIEHDKIEHELKETNYKIFILEKQQNYDEDLKALVIKLNEKLNDRDNEIRSIKKTEEAMNARLTNQISILNAQVAYFQELNMITGSNASVTSESIKDQKQQNIDHIVHLFYDLHEKYHLQFKNEFNIYSKIFTDSIISIAKSFEHMLMNWQSIHRSQKISNNQVFENMNSSIKDDSDSITNNSRIISTPVLSPPAIELKPNYIVPDISDLQNKLEDDDEISLLSDDDIHRNTSSSRYHPKDLRKDPSGAIIPVTSSFPINVKGLYHVDMVTAGEKDMLSLITSKNLNTKNNHLLNTSMNSLSSSIETSITSNDHYKLKQISPIKESKHFNHTTPKKLQPLQIITNENENDYLPIGISSDILNDNVSDVIKKDVINRNRMIKDIEQSIRDLSLHANKDIDIIMKSFHSKLEKYLEQRLIDIDKADDNSTVPSITEEISQSIQNNHQELLEVMINSDYQNMRSHLNQITSYTSEYLKYLIQLQLKQTDSSFRLLDIETNSLKKTIHTLDKKCELFELLLSECRLKMQSLSLNQNNNRGFTSSSNEEYLQITNQSLREKVLDLEAKINDLLSVKIEPDISIIKSFINKLQELNIFEKELKFSALVFKQKASLDETYINTNRHNMLHKSSFLRQSSLKALIDLNEEEDESTRASRAERGIIGDLEIKALKHTAKLWRKKSKICIKRIEAIKHEIDDTVKNLMEYLQAYQRAAQEVLPVQMVEQILKANVRSFQELNNNIKNSSIPLTTTILSPIITNTSDTMDHISMKPFQSNYNTTNNKLKSNIILTDHLSNTISTTNTLDSINNNDLHSINSSSLLSQSLNSITNKSYTSHKSINSTNTISNNSIRNDNILAERMKSIMKPITKFGSTGSIPEPQINSHLKYKK